MPGGIEIGTDRLEGFSVSQQPAFKVCKSLPGTIGEKIDGKCMFSHSIRFPFFFDKYFSAGEEKGKRNRVRETG